MAAHLYRRAGFGANGAELDQSVKLGAARTIERLFNPPPPTEEFTSSSNLLAQRAVAGGNVQDLAGWWFFRMLNTQDRLQEKLALFLHGHFATSAAKVQQLWMMLDQNELFRRNARGKFRDLVAGVSRDPAMLVYLDSTSNRRIHPNENYARELMELFTLGVGNYTEKDIKEIARSFTGWELLGDHFHFDEVQHDTGTKTFLGATGNFNGDDAVDIVLKQPAASRFMAAKLIRFFAFDEPAAPQAVVDPIAAELREHEFRIGPAVQRILGSNLFFSKFAIGRKVRSPVDLAVGLLRSLGATTSLLKLAQGTADLGQSLFQPPNVKGWDGGRMWINSSTLLGRANFVGQALTAPETRFEKVGGSLSAAARSAGAETSAQIVDWLVTLLVAAPIPAAARQVLVELADQDKSDRNKAVSRVIHAIGALPEFQLM
jgi:uncharacterized protein (DUF1800 family)